MRNTIVLLALWLCSCATYNTAEKVSMVAFDDMPTKGKSVGNIKGQDCTWQILGYQLGGLPTVEKAFINARNGNDGGGLLFGVTGETNSVTSSGLKYVNNVSTRNDGFSAGVIGKNCIVVSGVGYK